MQVEKLAFMSAMTNCKIVNTRRVPVEREIINVYDVFEI